MGVSGSSRDLTIKVTLDASGAVLGLESMDRKLEDVRGTVDGTERGFSNFQANLVTFSSALTLVQQGFGILQGAAQTAIAAIKQGDQISDVEQSFAALSQQAGVLSDTFLNDLTTATGQTIDNFTLQREAIEAVRAGAKPDEFVQLTEAARALAEQTGGDTLTEMRELSTAFETGNVKALKNKLGIIDLEKAENEFAKSIGVTRDELSKEGQVQAARLALLEASKNKTAEVGKITNSAADNIDRIAASLINFKNATIQAIAQSTALASVLDSLAKLVTLENFKRGQKRIEDFAKTQSEALPIIGSTIAAYHELQDALEPATDVVKDSIKVFDDQIESVLGAAEAEGQLKKKTDELATKIKGATEAALKGNNAFIDTQKALDRAREAGEKHKKELEESLKLYKKLNSAEGVLEYRKKIEELLTALSTGKVKEDEYLKSLNELRQAWVDGKGDAQRFAEILTDETDKALEDVETKIEDTKDDIKAKTGAGGFLADIFGLDADTGDALGQSLTDIVQTGFDVLNTAIQGGDINTEELINSLATSIGQGIGSLFGQGELGAQIGSLVGNLINSFAEAFGGDSAGTKARKAADKFFADAFDAQRLSVLINGQLVQIADLVFGGNSPFAGAISFGVAESGFFNAFNQLPQIAQNAFNGVGLAFAAFLGDIEHLAGTLGAVFVNNIGGSLNNLQQLILATGVSVEDLEKALIDAALNGEISFVQAQGALDQLRQVMQQGIPDAVGAVVQAFQNLRNAGVTGGRFAVDALKDIAAEARELGLHTIPDVLSYLVSTGQQSAESVQILQNALAAFGITTLEQLQNLSNETAIAILANLQANNFPFEETQSQIDALREQLASIPQNIQRNLIFNVRVNGSQEDIDFVRHAQVTIPGQGPGPA